MTARLGIPADALNAATFAVEDAGIGSTESNHVILVALEAAAPHFLDWFVERLTSDEAVGAGGLALASECGEEFMFADRSGLHHGPRIAYRLSAAKAIGAALAAALSVDGKDGAALTTREDGTR